MHIVQDDILPRYLATFSAVGDCPIYGAVIAAHPVAPPKIEVQWMSTSPTVRLFHWGSPPPSQISKQSMVDEGSALLRVATHDEVARSAAYDLQTANLALYSRAPDTADAKSILMTYYFVLDRIAQRVSPKPLKTPETFKSIPHLERLEQQLHAAETVEAKVDAVKRAATKLQELHARGMKQQVMDAGEVLSLSPNSVSSAGDFTALRHARLAHTSKLGELSSELDPWLERAQTCAIEYLSGYLRWAAASDAGLTTQRGGVVEDL